jgi:hypothetical protein
MKNNFITKLKENDYYSKFMINNENNYILHFKSFNQSIFTYRLINNKIYGIDLYKY